MGASVDPAVARIRPAPPSRLHERLRERPSLMRLLDLCFVGSTTLIAGFESIRGNFWKLATTAPGASTAERAAPAAAVSGDFTVTSTASRSVRREASAP